MLARLLGLPVGTFIARMCVVCGKPARQLHGADMLARILCCMAIAEDIFMNICTVILVIFSVDAGH
jgi:hypothetical protein